MDMQDFEVIVIDGAYPSSVVMSRDILDAAAHLAAGVGAPAPRWGMYSITGGPVHLRDGIVVQTKKLPPRRAGNRSVCLVPGLGADPDALLARMRDPDCAALARRLAAHVRGGGEAAASCSAVFLLDAAGLLAGRRATTTWWLAPVLQRVSPRCVVDADRMVCADGPVTTAGAAFAHSDLMLHLLRARFGPRLVDAVSRWLLLEHRHSQAPFIVPEVLASGHSLVARLTTRLESALPDVPPITELARELCVSQKTLARHVRKATGKSTGDFVRSVKLRRARALLHESRMTVDQVAAAVGYQDATALRRLVRQSTGASPSHFRQAATVAR
jgi:transcriptional regulator GlxA family with amidase domain